MRLSLLRSLSYGVKNSPAAAAAAESHRSRFLFHRSFLPGTFNTTRIQFSNAAIIHQELKTQVQQFDIELPVEKAITPPSSWFTQKTFHELDKVCCDFSDPDDILAQCPRVKVSTFILGHCVKTYRYHYLKSCPDSDLRLN